MKDIEIWPNETANYSINQKWLGVW